MKPTTAQLAALRTVAALGGISLGETHQGRSRPGTVRRSTLNDLIRAGLLEAGPAKLNDEYEAGRVRAYGRDEGFVPGRAYYLSARGCEALQLTSEEF